MRGYSTLLIASTIVGSWMAMQAVHELGHVIGAWLTHAHVVRVELHPLAISRTEVAENALPLIVVWAGPLIGAILPVLVWFIAEKIRFEAAFVLRFFAGFCLVGNGLYIGVGSFDHVGDCHEMLRHGSAMWELWLFGALTTPIGFWLWHGLGSRFGLGAAAQPVSPRVAWGSFFVCLAFIAVGLSITEVTR